MIRNSGFGVFTQGCFILNVSLFVVLLREKVWSEEIFFTFVFVFGPCTLFFIFLIRLSTHRLFLDCLSLKYLFAKF